MHARRPVWSVKRLVKYDLQLVNHNLQYKNYFLDFILKQIKLSLGELNVCRIDFILI